MPASWLLRFVGTHLHGTLLPMEGAVHRPLADASTSYPTSTLRVDEVTIYGFTRDPQNDNFLRHLQSRISQLAQICGLPRERKRHGCVSHLDCPPFGPPRTGIVGAGPSALPAAFDTLLSGDPSP